MSKRPLLGVTRMTLVSGLFAALAWSSATSAQDRRLLDANGYVRDDAYAALHLVAHEPASVLGLSQS